MNFLPGWFPAGASVVLPPETTWAGAINDATLGNSKAIACVYGPVHSSRHAYLVVTQAQNANLSTTGNISSVDFDGIQATQLFMFQSGASHASAWGVALPSGASGTCNVIRNIGNGFAQLKASCFTVNHLLDPLTLIDFVHFASDPQDEPWTFTINTLLDGVILGAVQGPGGLTSPDLVIDNQTGGSSPVTSVHLDMTPGATPFAGSTSSGGGGNQNGALISLR